MGDYMDFIKWLVDNFGINSEIKNHVHCSQERAELFQSAEGSSTEFEVLSLINSLVRCYKPSLCLETGTFFGYGTIAIADALKQNKLGRLITLDYSKEYLEKAKHNVSACDKDFMNLVSFYDMNSVAWINAYQGEPFDFVFFDSDLNFRAEEFQLLRYRNLIKPGAVCIFHDTSPTRCLTAGDNANCISFMDKLLDTYEGISSPYSRGFTVIRIDPKLIFDEEYYLENNIDVARSIQAGWPKTGYEHFCKFGCNENRKFRFSKI
jgi:predicted O-methyltransferase YrrM